MSGAFAILISGMLILGAFGIGTMIVLDLCSQRVSLSGLDMLFGIYGFGVCGVIAGTTVYLFTGFISLSLKTTREERTSIRELFSAGKSWLRMLAGIMILAPMIGLGLVCYLLPGLFLAVLFLPFPYVLVDEDQPVNVCFTRAKSLTWGNLGSMFIVVTVGTVILVCGVVFGVIPAFFTTPYVAILWALAYDYMIRQSPIE